jgi:membrane-bound inhibitor of C-type lysozyme
VSLNQTVPAILGLLFLAGCSSASVAEARPETIYRCADGRTFSVDLTTDSARVTYYDEQFRLPRRSSGIGSRYASPDATLIIDGEMAVFVTENIVDLQACRALPA